MKIKFVICSRNKYEVFGDVGDFYLLNLKNAGRTIEVKFYHNQNSRNER